MKNRLDPKKLESLSSDLSESYQSSQPYAYIVIDEFRNPHVLEEAVETCPSVDDLDFYKYDNPLEKKLAFDQASKLPNSISNVLYAFNSPAFLNFLEKLTGIDHLIPDPYLRGGGIHMIEKGGKLDVHVDFNWHHKLKLHRRLNVLLYLNKDWKEEYNGDFQIWKGHKDGDKHILESLEQRVYPEFNRLAVFSTSEKSYHGFPDRLNCPEGQVRKSLAWYYYTSERDDGFETEEAHSTTFIKRPEEDDSLDELREKRNKGRLNSNVKL